ncbi:NAD-dependent deacylase [Gordonia shandongensis]|uniref:NAD-dependent deacylase n=1 Tax=Gordonia shandongensis TaxID=376351 RepID=UPI000421180B|nr:NAD-dependent deacylase [Gordonia shandongensis]
MSADSDTIARASALIADARDICVFSGAGMSAESGIPTFRDALTGLWAEHSPEDLATPEGWARDPDLVWGWYRDRADRLRTVTPNAGHRALADLHRNRAAVGGGVHIVTQNVDDLHERAGSTIVSHLHGDLTTPRCSGCGRRGSPTDMLTEPRPSCPLCGASLRPDVVWFGEMLPGDQWADAERAVDACDLMIVVGTSGVVHPAAMLPERAAHAGTPIVEVNPDPSAVTAIADVHVPGTAAAALPRIT